MTKHKCGTCRFFQEARLAGSGWCHHPQRRTTSDVMIMVRRNELACRDEWAHDLWMAVEDGKGAVEGAVPESVGPLTARREPAATEGEIAALLKAQTAPVDRGGNEQRHEDVVVGETLVIAESERDWAWQREDAAASRVGDTRAAIIKARETYRDRARSAAPGRFEERAPLSSRGAEADTTLGASEEPDGATGEPTVPEAAVAPAPPDPSLRRTRPAVVFDGFDDVPSVVPGFEIPNVERRPDGAERPAKPSEDDSPPALAADSDGGAAAAPAAEPPVSLASVRRHADSADVGAGPPRRRTERRPLEPSLVPVRVERRSGASTPYRTPADDAVPDLDLTVERREDATALIQGRRGPFRHDPPPVPVREVAERWGAFAEDEDLAPDDTAVTVDASAASAAYLPLEDVVVPTRRSEEEPPLDLTIRVAPDLPRTCRMCRDYRPAEGGARGWCANEWAFTHRRVVDPDERMPCETSLGSWWLPVDAIWLASTDVSSHGQPTPILDAVVAHHRAEPLQRRGS